MKFAILNDTHSGCRNSSDIFLNYHEKFYRDVFFPYCNENGIKHILHLGDFYDNRKTITLKSLYHNRKCFLEPLREMGMTMDIIPGNHDVTYKSTNDLCSLKELLGHFMNNVNIVMKPKVVDYDGFPIALLPWINNENYDESIQFISTCKASILAGHLELEGFEVLKGVKSHEGMNPKLFSRFDKVWSGHFHTQSKRENIHYLGTQFEITWSDCGDPKFFHVFDTDENLLTPIRNPHTIFKKVYYDDRKNQSFDMNEYKEKFVKVIVLNKTNNYEFDKFIDDLTASGTYDIKIAENFDEFTGDNNKINADAMKDTGELLNQYVDSIETDLNKEKIKQKLQSLYVEAQNMEVL